MEIALVGATGHLAPKIGPGPLCGAFRSQAQGSSRIGHADHASACVDETDHPRYLR